nr:MAG TPA: hypothetical protein [Caudoviricetes sp.]
MKELMKELQKHLRAVEKEASEALNELPEVFNSIEESENYNYYCGVLETVKNIKDFIEQQTGITTIHVKSINADIYLDKWRENADKIRMYDSNEEYLGYYEPDSVIRNAEKQGITEQQYLDNEAKRFANMVNLNGLLNYVGIYSYTIARTDDLSPIIEDFADSCDEENPLIEMSREEQIAWLKTNETINFIGDYIIHNTEL